MREGEVWGAHLEGCGSRREVFESRRVASFSSLAPLAPRWAAQTRWSSGQHSMGFSPGPHSPGHLALSWILWTFPAPSLQPFTPLSSAYQGWDLGRNDHHLQSWCVVICNEEVPGLHFMAETLLSLLLCSTGVLWQKNTCLAIAREDFQVEDKPRSRTMWAAKRGRGRKELGKGTDKVMTEEKSVLFGIQSIPEVQIAISLQRRGRPVNVQLNGCDIPKDWSLDQPGSSASQPRCGVLQKGFPRRRRK